VYAEWLAVPIRRQPWMKRAMELYRILAKVSEMNKFRKESKSTFAPIVSV